MHTGGFPSFIFNPLKLKWRPHHVCLFIFHDLDQLTASLQLSNLGFLNERGLSTTVHRTISYDNFNDHYDRPVHLFGKLRLYLMGIQCKCIMPEVQMTVSEFN